MSCSTYSRAIAGILLCAAALSWCQAPPTVKSKPAPSLTDSIKRVNTENTQLHILYVHGMGASGPGGSASADLRKSICKFLRDCTTTEGEFDGTDYADAGDFALNSAPPSLRYLGQSLWKVDANGASEEWNASVPYVDHYKLTRRGDAPTIYLDEINWWPLVFAAKCRQIIGEDADLAGPNKTYLRICSLPATPDPNPQKNPGRFRTYPFLSNVQQLNALPPKGAVLNRALKTFVLDWGFADAVLAVGPMRPLFLEGIGELVRKSVKVAADGSRGENVIPAPKQEFVIVSHSLGSYLMFSALDLKEADSTTAPKWQAEFDYVLANTSKAYFLANQVRLLELANLDITGNGNLITHLKTWSDLRQNAHKPVPQIVAWSDPSDLLTWSVPLLDPQIAKVCNQVVQNAPHWFWLIESPGKAHTTYDQNKRVIKVMLPREKQEREIADRCESPL
ncbi:MAG: hypothetical protein WCB53_04585 [Terriglobales bacterium]